MKLLARIGAVAFLLWGLLHIVGGSAILFALGEGPEFGYALYQDHAGTYTPLSGAILGYFAYLLVCIAIAVSVIAVRLNWRNSRAGFAANTILVGLTDVGLVLFLLVPGFVLWSEALLGLGLFAVALAASGIASRTQ